MSEINATLKWFFERKSGLLYSTYAIAFTISNWKFFYILIFSAHSSGSERIYEAQTEFINRYAFGFNWGEYWVGQFLLPALITFIIIKFVPILNQWAYEEFLNNEKERNLAKHRKDAKLAHDIAKEKEKELGSYQNAEEFQKEINELITQVNELQGQLEKENNKDKQPTKEWEEEYQKLKKTRHFQDDFWAIKDLLMDYGGRMYALDNIYGPIEAQKIIKDYIFLLTSGNVLQQVGDTISLTKKGTYIMARYIEDIQKDGAQKHNFKTGIRS